MEMNVRLHLILNTLDGLTVTGRENMERVLACCQEIEKILNDLENPVPDVEEAENG